MNTIAHESLVEVVMNKFQEAMRNVNANLESHKKEMKNINGNL